MQAKTLKQPGRFSNAERLRREVAVAISHVETAKAKGATGEGAALAAFLLDAGAKTPGVVTGSQEIVNNGDTLPVKNSAASKTVSGAVTVVAGDITAVSLASTEAIVSNAQTGVPVTNSASVEVPGTHTADVALGVVTRIRLASDVAALVNAVKVSGFTVTGSGTFFTPTVVNGVCTGGVLSES